MSLSHQDHGVRVRLEPTDLQIEAGETLVLLGPSGCGKTTTLRIIAGLESPDAGSVHFNDEDVTHLPIEQRNVGMVFQSYALLPATRLAGGKARDAYLRCGEFREALQVPRGGVLID